MLVSQYLATSYRPDREYIDGHVFERNVGELDHSRMIGEILYQFREHKRTGGLQAIPAWWTRVSPARIRVPDVIVVRGNPGEQVLTHPPFLCIEILSPHDSMTLLPERIDDYLAFGAEDIWIVDPSRKQAFWEDKAGFHQCPDGILSTATAPVRMDLAPVWFTA
jgi:Uma2 family endonuclease